MSDLVGQTIGHIRPMTKKELDEFGWYDNGTAVVIILSDGTKLFPSCDPEGNAAGALFGSDKEGDFIVTGAR